MNANIVHRSSKCLLVIPEPMKFVCLCTFSFFGVLFVAFMLISLTNMRLLCPKSKFWSNVPLKTYLLHFLHTSHAWSGKQNDPCLHLHFVFWVIVHFSVVSWSTEGAQTAGNLQLNISEGSLSWEQRNDLTWMTIKVYVKIICINPSNRLGSMGQYCQITELPIRHMLHDKHFCSPFSCSVYVSKSHVLHSPFSEAVRQAVFT